MEYISIFRCKTKSVIWGFFTKQLADHIRKFEGTHTFPFIHPGVLGHLLESQKAKRAFTTLGRSCLFDHWLGKKVPKVQFSLEYRCFPDHSSPALAITHETYGKRRQDLLPLCMNLVHGGRRGPFGGQSPGENILWTIETVNVFDTNL